MIDKATFEAHVRAEAEAKYAEYNYRDMGPLIRAGHTAYIAARMEHEWPLVEALHGIQAKAKWYADNGDRLPLEVDHALCVEILDAADQALSPYTTKPTDQ